MYVCASSACTTCGVCVCCVPLVRLAARVCVRVYDNNSNNNKPEQIVQRETDDRGQR